MFATELHLFFTEKPFICCHCVQIAVAIPDGSVCNPQIVDIYANIVDFFQGWMYNSVHIKE